MQLPPAIAELPPKLALAQALAEMKRRRDRNKLVTYKPYEKQKEFHAAGSIYSERLFTAGNQLGKTLSGAFEMAMHLTGRYPDWWTGRRFDKPVRAMAGSESAELTRKGVQRLLVGPPEIEAEWGTGAIPGDCIIGWSRKQGVADAIASIQVKHASGGVSVLQFNSYDQGRGKWQADTVDIVWFDEEPPYDIYNEGITRTNATHGIVFTTFTPLKGMSETVDRFYPEPKFPGCTVITMTIYDVDHYTPEEREAIIAKYPAHERDARTMGTPTLGSGLIFPVTEESIVVDPFPLPDIWPRIAALDFGWDHPTAGAWLAWDRDEDVIYVYDCFREREKTPPQIAPLIQRRGHWIPIAWPHDGLQHEKGSGIQLAEQYRNAVDEDGNPFNLNMLHEMAQFPETGAEGEEKVSRTSVEAGVSDMLTRMQQGKWKVFKTCTEWLEERRLYHRKDGKIVKIRDDTLSASRYAYMMLRYASTPPEPSRMVDPRRPYNWRAG